MPDWLMSALIGALVAFVLNALFQTRRDMIASAIKGYAAIERYRAITETRVSILYQCADVQAAQGFTKYWNETQYEAREAEAAVIVLVNAEFNSLKKQLDSLDRATSKWINFIASAGREPYSKDQVAESAKVINRECDHMQSELLALSRPSWRRVFNTMLGID